VYIYCWLSLWVSFPRTLIDDEFPRRMYTCNLHTRAKLSCLWRTSFSENGFTNPQNAPRQDAFIVLTLGLKTGNGSHNVFIMRRDNSRNGERYSSSTTVFLGHADETKLERYHARLNFWQDDNVNNYVNWDAHIHRLDSFVQKCIARPLSTSFCWYLRSRVNEINFCSFTIYRVKH